METLTRLGLIGYGLLHLAVGWLALQIATGRPAAEGDHSGAFTVLASHPLGRFVVWSIALGLLAMTVWQLLEAAVGHLDEQGPRRVVERLVSVGRTVVYAALAWTAYRVASGRPTSSADQQEHATAGLLGKPGGAFWVGLIGVFVTVVGLVLAGYGLMKEFERRFPISQISARVRRAVAVTGLVGYASKGAVYAVAGVLLVVAAASYDPRISTGLDGALRTLAGQSLGRLLLFTLALGFAIFGVYCFLQSRYRKV
ncbi:MAG: DUF1206 domain-containing protein [Micromonosporaceae bacterium]